MRGWPAAAALSIVSQAVSSQPADDAIVAVESLFPIGERPAIEMFGKLVAGIGR